MGVLVIIWVTVKKDDLLMWAVHGRYPLQLNAQWWVYPQWQLIFLDSDVSSTSMSRIRKRTVFLLSTVDSSPLTSRSMNWRKFYTISRKHLSFHCQRCRSKMRREQPIPIFVLFGEKWEVDAEKRRGIVDNISVGQCQVLIVRRWEASFQTVCFVTATVQK